MNKILNNVALFICLAFAPLAIAATPVFDDEIPADYVKKVKTQRAEESKHTAPNLKNLDMNKAIAVRVYTPKTIKFKFKAICKDITSCTLEVTNIKLNDHLTLYVAEDVYKEHKLIIAKDTPAVGIVQSLNPPTAYGPPPEFKIGYFHTKDVNGNTIYLSGIVENPYNNIQMGSTGIKKNKIHILYMQ